MGCQARELGAWRAAEFLAFIPLSWELHFYGAWQGVRDWWGRTQKKTGTEPAEQTRERRKDRERQSDTERKFLESADRVSAPWLLRKQCSLGKAVPTPSPGRASAACVSVCPALKHYTDIVVCLLVFDCVKALHEPVRGFFN